MTSVCIFSLGFLFRAGGQWDEHRLGIFASPVREIIIKPQKAGQIKGQPGPESILDKENAVDVVREWGVPEQLKTKIESREPEIKARISDRPRIPFPILPPGD
jgi:hypothetical protein